MILKGKHKRNLFDFVDCIAVVEYGKLQRVKFPKGDICYAYLVEDYTDFDIEKYSNKRAEFYPDKHNYLLTYKAGGVNQQVFLKLSWIKEFELNWILKRFWLSKTENWIKILVSILVALTLYYLKYLLFP